ncbi:MAG: MarR family transcriptional regulator [Candidatus Aenigmarchaeota archaeon]|nr:MarR family transcriptional regulator [Candidatus Aenigmarchaeota archaeon]
MKIELGMEQVGIVVIIFSLAFFLLIFDFNSKIENLNSVLHETCNLPQAVCPFIGTPHQTYIAFSIDLLLALFGTFLIIRSRKTEKLNTTEIEKREEVIKALSPDEQKIYEVIKGSGAIFQSEIVEKSAMSKVKITRMLDKFESKGLVERKRRGMTNIVIVKK